MFTNSGAQSSLNSSKFSNFHKSMYQTCATKQRSILQSSEQKQIERTLTYDEIQQSIQSLMILKGEFVQEKCILVIKRPILLKIFLQSHLLDSNFKHDFEIMINKEYGNNKHSFSQEDINRVVILIAQNYFQTQFNKQPKAITLKIFQLCIIPYVYSLIEQGQTPIQKFLGKVSQHQINGIDVLQSLRRVFSDILKHYKDKVMRSQVQKSSRILFFNFILCPLLKDIDLCPYVISQRDLFCLFELQKAKNFDAYCEQEIFWLFLVIAEYFVLEVANPYNPPNLEEKIKILIKRIELSSGYEKFRKERIIESGKKPPTLLILDQPYDDLDCYRSLSRCNTSRKLYNSATPTEGRNYGFKRSSSQRQLSSQIDVSYLRSQVKNLDELQQVFQYYSKLDDRGQSQKIKSTQLYKLFQDIQALYNPQKSNLFSQNQLDILVQKVKGGINLCTTLDYDQFLALLDEVARTFYNGKHLRDLVKNLILPTYQVIAKIMENENIVISQSKFEGQSLRNKLVEKNAKNHIEELLKVLKKLKKCLEPYFKVFATQKNSMTLKDFSHFLTVFQLYPDLIKSSDLGILHRNLLSLQPSAPKFDLHLLIQALCLIALAHFDSQFSPLQRFLLMVEKIALVQNLVDISINKSMKNGTYLQGSSNSSRDMIRIFQSDFMAQFPEAWKKTSSSQQKKGKLSLKDIMALEDEVDYQ